MPVYDSGTARGQYILDISDAERKAAQRRGLFDALKRDAAAFGTAPRTNTSGIDQQVRAQQRLADSAIRVAAAQRDYTRALSLVDAELKKATPDTERYNALLARQATLQRQAASAANAAARGQRANGGFLSGLGGAAAAFGLGVIGPQIVGQAIGAGVQAGQDAIKLRETQNSLKALAGDYRVYRQVLDAAKEGQILFGGSLEENIDGLSGLVTVSRKTGAELGSLIDLSRRLAVLNPAQGLQGGLIALSEGLAGQTTSLQRRFNIPREALAKLRDESLSASDKLQILGQYLDSVGVSSQAVAGKVDQAGLAYRTLNAELDQLRTTTGGGAADFFAGSATGLARLIGLINQNPKALAELRAILSGRGAVTEADLNAATQDVAERLARTSIGADSAFGKVSLAQQFGSTAALDQVIAQIAQIQTIGGPANDELSRLIALFKQGGIAGPDFAREVAALVAQTQQQGYVSGEAAKALADQAAGQDTANKATGDAIVKGLDQQIQQRTTNALLKDAKEAAADVANGYYNQSDAVAFLKGKYPAFADQIDQIIGKQLQLASAADLAASRLRQQAGNTTVYGRADVTSPGRRGNGDDAIAHVVALQQEQTDLNQAYRDQAYILATTAGRVTILRGELAKLTPGTVEYIQKQTELKQAQQQLAAEQEAAATKGAKADTKRATSIATTQDQIENRLEDSYRRQVQLQEDYQRRAQRSQEDYDVRRSRDQEDYERKRRRLLAEGKRFEAEQLRQEFEREQRRDREDFERQRQRTTQDEQTRRQRELADAGIDTSRIRDRAAIRGVTVGNVGTLAGRPGSGEVRPLAAPHPTGAGVQQITIPITGTVYLDAEQVGHAVFDTVELRLTQDVLTVNTASAPRAAPSPLAGPRP